MLLVPTTRKVAELLAESVSSDEDLNPDQVAAFEKLYRLKDDRTVSELVTSGEISPISPEETALFIERLKHRRINTRADFDHAAAFLKWVHDPAQKAQVREILPSVTKTEFFLNELLRVLDGGLQP